MKKKTTETKNNNINSVITPAEKYSSEVVKATFDVMEKLETSDQRNAFLEYTKMIMLYIERIALYYSKLACESK